MPKVPNADKMSNFRPISCCNVLHKSIAKILANRIRECLPSLISSNQSGFVFGRSIVENVMLAQELVQNYHRSSFSPRCAIKIDLKKAFDLVDWKYIFNVLLAMEFPEQCIIWVKACVSTTRFTVNINGGLVGYFPGGKGFYLLIFLSLAWKSCLVCLILLLQMVSFLTTPNVRRLDLLI